MLNKHKMLAIFLCESPAPFLHRKLAQKGGVVDI